MDEVRPLHELPRILKLLPIVGLVAGAVLLVAGSVSGAGGGGANQFVMAGH